jgi:hypothetical protein
MPGALPVGLLAERAGASVSVPLMMNNLESVTAAGTPAGVARLATEVMRAVSVAALKMTTAVLVVLGLAAS